MVYGGINSVGRDPADVAFFLKTVDTYRPDKVSLNAVVKAAQKAGLSLDGLRLPEKYKPTQRGINLALFANKAPALYPDSSEMVAWSVLALDRAGFHAEAGARLADVTHEIRKYVGIQGKYVKEAS